ncbi:hypothetical protein CHS0354_031761, partial [Potamilus streckersoni]
DSRVSSTGPFKFYIKLETRRNPATCDSQKKKEQQNTGFTEWLQRIFTYPPRVIYPYITTIKHMELRWKKIICVPLPITRPSVEKLMEIYFLGLSSRGLDDGGPNQNGEEICSKGPEIPHGHYWGFPSVYTGVRVIRVTPEDAKKIPSFFYVLGFTLKS